MDEDEGMICPLCKHEMYQYHVQISGVYGYVDWCECDWCGYSTNPQKFIFAAKETH